MQDSMSIADGKTARHKQWITLSTDNNTRLILVFVKSEFNICSACMHRDKILQHRCSRFINDSSMSIPSDRRRCSSL